MNASKRTKKLLAETLEEMMKRNTVEDIRVQDICDRAGIARSVFYYHFSDKYELISWIYVQDTIEAYEEVSGPVHDEGLYRERIRISLLKFREKERFYSRAFKAEDQNSLRSSMWEFCVRNSYKELRDILKTDSMSEDLQNAVKFYYYGIIELTRGWVLREIKCDAAEMARYYLDFMPKVMNLAYQKGIDIGCQNTCQ